VSHHTAFDQHVNATAARMKQVCSVCGGKYSIRVRRVWHEFGCRYNPINRRNFYPPEEQDRDMERLRKDAAE